jgi:hypothetical protein
MLSRIQMATPNCRFRQFVAGSHELAALVGPGPIITDRQPSIECTRTLPAGERVSTDRFSRDPGAILR